MTLSEIRTLVSNFLSLDLDNYYGSAPSNTELTVQVNWAIRKFAEYTWCCYEHKNVLTLTTGTQVYNCHSLSVVQKKVLQPKFVTLNSITLRGPDGQYGLWSLSDLHEGYPGYQTYENGTPTRAVWLPGHKLLLSSPPDAAAAAETDNFISGPYLPADLVVVTDDANAPDIPVQYHETLAYIAARRASMPMVSEQEAWGRISAYQGMEMEGLREARNRYRNALRGPRQIRGARSDWMRDTFSV